MKVIRINGEDVTDEYNAGNKVCARVLEMRERAFHKSQSIHKINEKYSMLRTGSRVTLVKSEVEENEAGEKVNILISNTLCQIFILKIIWKNTLRD